MAIWIRFPPVSNYKLEAAPDCYSYKTRATNWKKVQCSCLPAIVANKKVAQGEEKHHYSMIQDPVYLTADIRRYIN